MTVGRYAGTPVDQLPNSYLRWMIGQKFPKEILDIVVRKLKDSSWSDEYVHVTRHALDMFSQRFLSKWMQVTMIRKVGIATYVAECAQKAWEEGRDVSKRRHQDDGITKQLDGIKWVFSMSPQFPDYREVITIMPASE